MPSGSSTPIGLRRGAETRGAEGAACVWRLTLRAWLFEPGALTGQGLQSRERSGRGPEGSELQWQVPRAFHR